MNEEITKILLEVTGQNFSNFSVHILKMRRPNILILKFPDLYLLHYY